jgi:hypothetical protein
MDGAHDDFDKGSTADQLFLIQESPRALVFLTVAWSGPERHARQAFRIASIRLVKEFADLGIQFITLDEDDNESLAWLTSLKLQHFDSGYPRGAGGLLWLENGRVVSSEISALSLGADGITARTLSLWRRNS